MTMMVCANLKKDAQVRLWSESFNCIGLLVNVILKVDQNEPAVESCTGNSVKNWFNRLVQFGRIGYVAKKDKVKVKITE